VYINYFLVFHHGISNMNIWYFNQIDTFYCSLFLYLPYPTIIQQLSVHFIMPSSYGDAMYFDIIYSLSFSFLLLSYQYPQTLKQSHNHKCVYVCTYISYIYIHDIYMLYICVYMPMICIWCIYICIYTHTHVYLLDLVFIYKWKHVIFVLAWLTYLT
jgi:hypothetical protein